MQLRPIVLCTALAISLTAQESETPAWKAVARMEAPRTGHCAVGLSQGRVLIVGGRGADGVLRPTEIHGPEDRFTPAAPLAHARSGHTCTLLDGGRVLVAGGANESGAEVWDPAADAWAQVTGDAFPNTGHTATKLAHGQVLLAGGGAEQGLQATLALYDAAATEIRKLDATLMDHRKTHAAARLSDGRVLLSGGEGGGRRAEQRGDL